MTDRMYGVPEGSSLKTPLQYERMFTFEKTNTPNSDVLGVPTRISELSPGSVCVLITGRIVNHTDVRSFVGRKDPGKSRWNQSFHIKDDTGVVQIRIWCEDIGSTEKYASFTLDNLVRVRTVDIRPVYTQNSDSIEYNAERSTSIVPYVVNLNDSPDSISYMELVTNTDPRLYKSPISINDYPRASIHQLKEICKVEQQKKSTEVVILACVKKVFPTDEIMSRRGALKKRCIILVDSESEEIPLFLWSDHCTGADYWIPLHTILLISNPTISLFQEQPQLTFGYRALIEVDPDFREAQWLRKYASTLKVDPDTSQRLSASGTTYSNYQYTSDKSNQEMFSVLFKISELDTKAKEMKASECIRGIMFACVSQFNIDSENPTHSITMAECKHCSTRFHYQLAGECCPQCGNPPDRYFYSLTHQLSFIDDTAELHSPLIDDYAIIKLIGYRPEEFATLNSHEKTMLKYSVLFERFKLFFMMYKNDMKQSIEVRIVDCEKANLEEMLNLTYLVSEMYT